MEKTELIAALLKGRELARNAHDEFVPDVCGREIENQIVPNANGLMYTCTYFGKYHLDSTEMLLHGSNPLFVYNTQCHISDLPCSEFGSLENCKQRDEFARKALDFLRFSRTLSFDHTESKEKRKKRYKNLGCFVYETDKWPSDQELQFRECLRFEGFPGSHLGSQIGKNRKVFSFFGYSGYSPFANI